MAMASPVVYEPSALAVSTAVTVGTAVSITMAWSSEILPAAPGAAGVMDAALPAASLMVPPLRVKGVVAI